MFLDVLRSHEDATDKESIPQDHAWIGYDGDLFIVPRYALMGWRTRCTMAETGRIRQCDEHFDFSRFLD